MIDDDEDDDDEADEEDLLSDITLFSLHISTAFRRMLMTVCWRKVLHS